MKKYLIFAAVLFVVFLFVFALILGKGKTQRRESDFEKRIIEGDRVIEECSAGMLNSSGCDNPSKVLLGIKKDTGLVFSNIEKTDFFWLKSDIKDDRVKISGYTIASSNKDTQDVLLIEDYLRLNEFEKDENNQNVSPSSSSIGYVKEDVVCVFLEKEIAESDLLELEVYCGEYLE